MPGAGSVSGTTQCAFRKSDANSPGGRRNNQQARGKVGLPRCHQIMLIQLTDSFFIRFFFCRLYTNLLANHEWINDLHAADAILVATHSQGCIVSTHLLDRLIHDKHIKTSRTSDLLASASAALSPGGMSLAAPRAQRVCCLALCGIHLGPLRYLSSSSLVLPYIQVSNSFLDVSAAHRVIFHISVL